jgi:uncharacterized SAM-binding protein YcdF (DUF218 family)
MGENLAGTLEMFLAALGIFLVSMAVDPSRYRNIFFLDVVLFFALSMLGAAASYFSDFGALAVSALVVLGILIFPLFLIGNGVTMWKREGRSLANQLSLLLGIFLTAGEIGGFLFLYAVFSAGGTSQPFFMNFRWVLVLVVTAVYLGVTFLSFLLYTLTLQIVPHRRDFDYIIIHGAGLQADGTVTRLLGDRCDKAVSLYRRDPTPPILLPSGGQGKDEVCSEARAMRAYLLQQGIPADHILLEDKSTTTMENLQNCKSLIESRPGRHYTALVTSSYHVYRAQRYARKIGLKAVGIGSRVAAYYWPSALIREFIAIHGERKHLVLFLAGYLLVLIPIALAAFMGV